MVNKIILLICVSLITVACGSTSKKVLKRGEQNGILATSLGVLTLNDEVIRKEDTIKLFNDDGSVWYKFSFYYDDSDGVYDFQNENFQPYAFHPDYFVLALLVVKRTDDSYVVMVNQKHGLTKMLPKADFLRFCSWSDFIITKVFSIKPNEKSNGVLSDSVKGSLLELDLDNITLHPVQIKDDWLKVRWKVGQNWSYGWIRWKNKGELLITLSMTS
jgi:hypothetical protein